MIQKCKRIISWRQILQVRVGLALTNSTDWPARRLLDSRSPWLTSTENNTLHITIVSWWGTYFILSEQYNYNAFLLFDLQSVFWKLTIKKFASPHHKGWRHRYSCTNFKMHVLDKLVEQWFHFHWLESTCDKHKDFDDNIGDVQGCRTCGANEEASRSSKANDERVIINFRDKNAVIASDKNDVFYFLTKCHVMSWYLMICHAKSWYVLVCMTKM